MCILVFCHYWNEWKVSNILGAGLEYSVHRYRYFSESVDQNADRPGTGLGVESMSRHNSIVTLAYTGFGLPLHS